jgi:hypothetical protein
MKMKTAEERLAEGLDKFDSKDSQKVILGCMLHVAVLVVTCGFGYYLGWGLTFMMFGGYMLLFTLFKIYKFYKGEDANE